MHKSSAPTALFNFSTLEEEAVYGGGGVGQKRGRRLGAPCPQAGQWGDDMDGHGVLQHRGTCDMGCWGAIQAVPKCRECRAWVEGKLVVVVFFFLYLIFSF